MDRVCLGSARRVPELVSTSQISEVPKPRFMQSFQPAAVRRIAPLSRCECVKFRKRRQGAYVSPMLARGGCVNLLSHCSVQWVKSRGVFSRPASHDKKLRAAVSLLQSVEVQ